MSFSQATVQRGPVVILGAGRQAVESGGYCRRLGMAVAAYVEEFSTGEHSGLDAPVADFSTLAPAARQHPALTAVGRADVRRRFVEAWGDGVFATVVDETAWVSDDASLGEGTTVAPGALVNRLVSVGRHVLINSGAIVCHDVVIGDFATVGPGVTIGGVSVIGEGAFVGIGATITDRVTVGNRAVVGAGAVVIEDVPDGVTVVGVPARQIARG